MPLEWPCPNCEMALAGRPHGPPLRAAVSSTSVYPRIDGTDEVNYEGVLEFLAGPVKWSRGAPRINNLGKMSMKPTTITITGTEGNQFTVNTSSLSPFSNVIVADSNGQPETLTLTVSAPAHGTLSNLGSGSYNSATGVYTVTGTAAEVTAALDNLAFTPTVADQAIKTTFAIRVADSSGNTAFDNTTTVTAAHPITIATNGVTTLASLGNPNGTNDTYVVQNISGSVVAFLTFNGSAVTVGEFGPWTPVGAIQTGSGYEVAWGNSQTNQYTVWNVDSNGAFTGSATGILSSTNPTQLQELEGVEANFSENGNHGKFLPGAGTPATPSTTGLGANGQLAAVGNLYELNPGDGTAA